jgi:hypothetical protein
MAGREQPDGLERQENCGGVDVREGLFEGVADSVDDEDGSGDVLFGGADVLTHEVDELDEHKFDNGAESPVLGQADTQAHGVGTPDPAGQ